MKEFTWKHFEDSSIGSEQPEWHAVNWGRKQTPGPRRMGKKVECRGNICLGTHEIGCEMSPAVCLPKIEIDRGRVGDTDKKIVTVARFKSDLPSLQFRSDEAAYINQRWASASLRRCNTNKSVIFPPHEVSGPSITYLAPWHGDCRRGRESPGRLLRRHILCSSWAMMRRSCTSRDV